MAALIHCQHLSKSFGTQPLFNGLTLGVSENDHLGIIGPNGSGKTTLLKILAGLDQADEGTVTRRQHLRIAYIPQQPEFQSKATVFQEIERAALTSGLTIEEQPAQIQEILGKTGFENGSQPVANLSGGWKKRLAIACGWVQMPDVMVLDEPTNHLDLQGLNWLEQVLIHAPWPWVMVSHDRWLLESATNKIAEINSRYPEGLLLVDGSYSEFLEKRQAYQKSQAQQARALRAA